MKHISILLLIVINCYLSCGASLRRTPKVYNALITTDENLTSSRAFPVIQPTIHEYPFGPYNPYPFYSPPLVSYGQPIVPGLVRRDQPPYVLPQDQYPLQIAPQFTKGQPLPGYYPPQFPPHGPPSQQPNNSQLPPPNGKHPNKTPVKPQPTPKYEPMQQDQPQETPNERLPISLNEYGLPPALIPLPQHPSRNSPPIKLPPYGFSQYPITYDPITGYPEQYLPPYGYYPSHTFVVGPPSPPSNKPGIPPTPAPMPDKDEENETTESELNTPFTEPTIDFIKNGSKSKNSAVRDVPPPPIPGKSKKQ